jgi:hypothetical protein
LSLALSATRLFITSHVVDGKFPVKKLLEMFNTCKGRSGVEDGSSLSPPIRWLKLTSRTTMLLDDTNSSGKPPDRELRDKLRLRKLVSLPRDGETLPSRPLDARETSATALFASQVMPSQAQQSVSFRHDAPMPPSCDRPARNRRRECFSCSVHELAGEAKNSRSSRREWPTKGRQNLVVLLLHKDGGIGFIVIFLENYRWFVSMS